MSAREEAEELLPCSWEVHGEKPCPPGYPGCIACTCRPAVTAALEARDKRIEELEEANTNQQFHFKRSAQLLVDNADEIQSLRAQLAALKAEVERLKAKEG